ncbi:MAG: hypothetical protein C3F08_00415 [Candidatus Methylomirabilota bacterium]|nr:MAG: hypothetical protein C3F08_00415 [candidate division NC10 bacterium]
MKRVLTIMTGALIAAMAPAPVFAFKATMSAKVEAADKPVVIGTTNLPEGTELMVTVKRSESGYMAQDKTRVSNGGFRVGPFSQGGRSVEPRHLFP